VSDEAALLLEQLEEALDEGPEDEEDALEVAMLAGLAARLGESGPLLQRAAEWRDGPGRAHLAETWRLLDANALVEAIEDCVDGTGGADAVAEALSDLDEIVAAAIWSGRPDGLDALTREAERSIRAVPEAFASASSLASDRMRLRGVADALELYGWWLAVAEAAAWA